MLALVLPGQHPQAVSNESKRREDTIALLLRALGNHHRHLGIRCHRRTSGHRDFGAAGRPRNPARCATSGGTAHARRRPGHRRLRTHLRDRTVDHHDPF